MLTAAGAVEALHQLRHLVALARRQPQGALVGAEPPPARPKLPLGAQAQLQLVQGGASGVALPLGLQQPCLEVLMFRRQRGGPVGGECMSSQ